jgi:hypothetical protein
VAASIFRGTNRETGHCHRVEAPWRPALIALQHGLDPYISYLLYMNSSRSWTVCGAGDSSRYMHLGSGRMFSEIRRYLIPGCRGVVNQASVLMSERK